MLGPSLDSCVVSSLFLSHVFFALVLHVIPLLALLACVWSCLDLGVFCPLLGWPRMEQTIFNMIVRGSEALFKKI